MEWLLHSRSTTTNEKLEIIDYLQSKVESGEATVSPVIIGNPKIHQMFKTFADSAPSAKLPGDFFKKKLTNRA